QGEVRTAGGGDVDEVGERPAGVVGGVVAAGPAELERAEHDQRQHDHEGERDAGPRPAGLTAQLGTDREDPPGGNNRRCGRTHRCALAFVSPPTRVRNASSRRRRGTTRSTPTPARHSAAPTSVRGVPSRSTTNPPPGVLSDIVRTPFSPASTAAAASTSDTSNCEIGESPTTSATGPSATTSPLCITTTWVQVC